MLLETGWVTPGTTVIPYGTVSAVDLDLVDVMDKVVVDDWGQAGAGPLGALRRRSAPCCATADLDVPASRLCAVRDGVADFQVVATAAGQRPAEDRGIT